MPRLRPAPAPRMMCEAKKAAQTEHVAHHAQRQLMRTMSTYTEVTIRARADARNACHNTERSSLCCAGKLPLPGWTRASPAGGPRIGRASRALRGCDVNIVQIRLNGSTVYAANPAPALKGGCILNQWTTMSLSACVVSVAIRPMKPLFPVCASLVQSHLTLISPSLRWIMAYMQWSYWQRTCSFALT